MAKTNKKDDERFVTVYECKGTLIHTRQIMVDRMTGVQYFCLSGGTTGDLTMTPLLDRDGKLLLYQPAEDE